MIKLWYLNSDAISQQVFNRLLQKVPVAIRQEVQRYKFFKDKKFKLFGRLMIERFYQCHLLPFDWRRWQKSNFGKPFVEGGHFFNISHSGMYICVAFSEQEVGVDLEEMKDIEVDSLLANFHQAEREYITCAADRKETFFDLWTRKESFLKAIGIGLTEGLDRQNCLKPVNEQGIVWFTHSLDLVPTYKLAITTSIASSVIEVTKVQVSNLESPTQTLPASIQIPYIEVSKGNAY